MKRNIAETVMMALKVLLATLLMTLKVFLATLLVLAILMATGVVKAETLQVNVRKGSILNGRVEPSTRAEKMCRFEKGDELTVLDMKDGWAKVDEGGDAEYNYVSWDYLSGGEGWPKTYRVSSDGRVKVRKNPSTDAKVVDYVKDGKKLTVFFIYDGFAKTKRGFISVDYLEEVETDDDAA